MLLLVVFSRAVDAASAIGRQTAPDTLVIAVTMTMFVRGTVKTAPTIGH